MRKSCIPVRNVGSFVSQRLRSCHPLTMNSSVCLETPFYVLYVIDGDSDVANK